FEVTDRIRVYHKSTDRLTVALHKLSGYVKQETLAVEIVDLENANGGIEVVKDDINGEATEVAVQRI
ncbi:MAG: hypothetical protein HY966_05525, partial [Ignavibacteriales bacterium]|nr:hypothetical protein [Ignavibacteriales bacterium]